MTVQQLRSGEGYAHHKHARLLKEEAESPNGCPLCSIMWKNLVGPPPPETDEESTRQYLNMILKPFRHWRNSLAALDTAPERSFLNDPIKVFLNPVGKCISDLQIYCGPINLMQELWWDPASREYFLSGEGKIRDEVTYPSPLEREGESRAKKKYPPVGVLTHSWSLERRGWDPKEYFMGQFRISVNRGSPIQNLIRYTQVSERSDSNEAISMIKSWIDRCLHSECGWRETVPMKLPTRVLDLGAPGELAEPKLIITKDVENSTSYDNRYIALSYCWGPKQQTIFATTTVSNIEERKYGIPLVQLPQTLQDAITLTKRLGVRYLWIDALCILQGSDPDAIADWSRESMKMAEVYGWAYLTIAAASASSVYEGFLNRQNTDLYQLKLDLVSDKNPADRHPILLGPRVPFHQSMDEPLYHRGWTLQERILSPRVLICNKDQYAWECQCRTDTESGEHMHSIGAMRLNASLEPGKPFDVATFRDAWQCIATDYSARSFTKPGDKLPALAGLAKKFSEFHNHVGGKYLAGIWERSLLDDLLWSHAPIDVGNEVPRSRPLNYRAPSWSWTAVNGNVRWPQARFNGYGRYFTRILDTHIESSQEPQDRFGSVSGGMIKVLGILKKISSETRSLETQEHPMTGQDVQNARVDQLTGLSTVSRFVDWRIFPDVSISERFYEIDIRARETGSAEFWLLRIKTGAVLILGEDQRGRLKGPRVFKRLGIIVTEWWSEWDIKWEKELFAAGKKEVVILI